LNISSVQGERDYDPTEQESDTMGRLIFFPLKMLGLVSAGFALGVGWKLGSYLVNTVMEAEMAQKSGPTPSAPGQEAEPLWKRKFIKISEG